MEDSASRPAVSESTCSLASPRSFGKFVPKDSRLRVTSRSGDYVACYVLSGSEAIKNLRIN